MKLAMETLKLSWTKEESARMMKSKKSDIKRDKLIKDDKR